MCILENGIEADAARSLCETKRKMCEIEKSVARSVFSLGTTLREHLIFTISESWRGRHRSCYKIK